MSDQPQFCPRVLPMPKVGDWVVITLSSPSDQRLCQVRSVDGGAFLCGREGNATRFERTISSPLAGAKSWCFADPAVEAQRLQEAAWRADTSPFPEAVADRVKYPANFPVNIQDILENILDDMIPCGNSFYDYSLSPSTAASCALEIVPHLLRWQAQQEQK